MLWTFYGFNDAIANSIVIMDFTIFSSASSYLNGLKTKTHALSS